MDRPVNDAPEPACQVCGGREIEVFYRAQSVPVHQNLVYRSRDEAIGCDRGEISLGVCRSCGFVSNLAFDPDRLSYSGHYDNSQACSGVFSGYMEDLADELVQRYDLHGKRLIEVGSGQGEFLRLLCRLGPNSGIGFDPAYIPGVPVAENGDPDVEFVREFYSERHVGVRADFICARHVLEHIQHPGEVIATIRRSIGDRTGTPLFLEVPSVAWILREVAFWDIFYEHCSYYSAGSLARLLSANAFEVVRAREAFGGQYLWLEGLAAATTTEPREMNTEVVELAESFERRWRDRREAVMAMIEGVSVERRTCVLWGAAGKGVTLLNVLGLQPGQVPVVVDVNPRKHGAFVPGTGQEIVPPAALSSIAPDVVLFTNPNYRSEIASTLTQLGLEPKLVSVHGA